jgi:hypothetical protein
MIFRSVEDLILTNLQLFVCTFQDGWIGIPLQGEAIVYSQPNEILANIAIDANIK